MTGLHERFKQRAEFAGPPEVLRMPLHAEAETAGRILQRFDDAVRCRRGNGQPFANVLGCLMVTAVHRTRIRVLETLAQRPFEQAVGGQPHVMRDREARFLDPMLDRRSDFDRNELDRRRRIGRIFGLGLVAAVRW